MTSYQQRKEEIRELESQIFQLEGKLNEHGIEFGQLTIDDKNMNIPKPPEPPLSRMILEGCGHFCETCGSSAPRSGFLSLFGKRYCINLNCNNSKQRKIKEGINYHEFFSGFWEWLKDWFSPHESYDLLCDSYRANSEFNQAINELSQSIKFPNIVSDHPIIYEELSSGEKIPVFINHKLLRKLKYGEKRYSISTPIVRAWKI